ncbi:MAG TPA: M20 family metallopeptidase [Microthrixaceae bacterium]|nr:M20 family metallopeptidase [Microthrixaceae bacterium]
MVDLTDVSADLRAEAEAIAADVVALRRAIHRRPELGLANPETQALILEALDGLGLEITTGRELTSVVATLRGARPGPTLLLRADTDALPMTEDTEWEHRSEIGDTAHVCGHDAHVAMLVGAARVLAAHRDELAGTVRFIFQPGEEGQGGAAFMLEEGILTDGLDEPVAAAFAIHITPNIPAGMVASRAGSLMASADEFFVTIRGQGGHASTPHFATDPVPVACEAVTALQAMVTRTVNAFDPAVVTVAHVTAGTTTNVIPETAKFSGTIRTVSEWTRIGVQAGVERVADGVAAAHDCTAEVRIQDGYPVTINDAGFVEFAAETVRQAFGEESWFEMPWPIMGAEDFSYILQKVPGAMFFLGVCPDDIANSLDAPSCHSNLMRLNESALPVGVALHAAVALRYLS